MLDIIKAIKLSGGLFGKVTWVVIILCICVTAICLKNETWWLPLPLIIPVFILIFYVFKRLFDFADKNPYAAIMEGAELLSHERLLHGKKGEDILFPTHATIDHQQPMLTNLNSNTQEYEFEDYENE